MSNTVEIVVEGKNQATKVFRQVSDDATDAARDTEQAWTKAMDSVNSSIERGGFGATEAGGGFNRLKQSAQEAGDEVQDVGRRSRESSVDFDRLGESADNVDTRTMGMYSTLSGAKDALEGITDASASTTDRLILLTGGMSDLGAGAYNFLVPAMAKAKQTISDMRDPTSDLRGRMDGVGRSMKGMAIGAAAIAGVGFALDAAFGEKAANVDALTMSLRDFVNTGKASGEAARVFGGDLDDLLMSFSMLHTNGVNKFLEGAFDLIPGSDLVGVSMSEAKSNVTALDGALANLARRSPAEASAAFVKLTQDMGLNKQETQKVRDSLPGFTTAMRQAANATEGSAASTERNAAALESYLTQLSAATDPVFNLLNSLNGVTAAQDAYSEVVKTSGANSAEAKDAAIALAEAVAQAEAAALNGDISYENFSASLDHWVQSGVVTAQQAASIRDRVNEARGSAQSYTGNYNAALYMENHASNIINRVKNELASFPDTTYKRFVMTYVQHIIGSGPPAMAPGGVLPLGRNADGGPIGHAATGGGRGGLTWVGEQGPELVQLPVGSFVNSAGASSRGGSSGGGAAPTQILVSVDISGGDRQLMDWLKNRIRIDGGGDVQSALGQR